MIKSRKVFLPIISSFYIIAFFSFYFALNHRVYAAGQAVTITPTSFATSTATEVTYHYNSTSEYAANDTVTITAAPGVFVEDCATSTIDADGTAPADGAAVVASQNYTYTFTGATTTAVSSGVTFCVKYSSVTAGNYSITFTDSKANPANNDFGSALIYIGDANDVTVTAQVQPILTFVIRDSADSTNVNICNLGILNPASVNSCSYRLKVGTNASSGYVVSVITDGDLRRSGSGDVADSEDIDIKSDAASTIVAGTEAYGIALTGNQASTGTAVTESTAVGFDYSVDDSPLPLPADLLKTFYTSTTRNDPTTTSHSALVTHKATVDTGTNTGNYTQLVTYTVVPNF